LRGAWVGWGDLGAAGSRDTGALKKWLLFWF
jgi:hypothetical protein